jgi:hypothetical protein
MTSWKTSTIGVGAAVAYLLYKLLSHQPLEGQDFVLAASLAAGGIAAKDADVHSTRDEVNESTRKADQ